jgi:hypothetical protein
MAQIIGGLIYKIFPELKELEATAEKALTFYQGIVDTTKSIGDYVTKNGDAIIGRIEKSFGGAVNEIRDDFQKNVTISPTILKSFSKPYTPGNGKGYSRGTAKAPEAASRTAPKPAQPKPAQNPAETYAKKESFQKGPEPITKAYQPKEKTRAEPTPTPTKPVISQEKKQETFGRQETLDEIVNDFREKLKGFNTGYDANIDVYDYGSVIKSYAPVMQKPKVVAQPKPKIADQRLIADQKYLEDSIRVTEMYNHGYNMTWIVNESARRGYEGVRNRTDITDRVALSLDSGLASYTRGKYDNTIATKLGAKEQVINDYLAGKSYKEIKENLKSKTNGMVISDSSILRTMHKYEKESRKKVVGKRKHKTSIQ